MDYNLLARKWYSILFVLLLPHPLAVLSASLSPLQQRVIRANQLFDTLYDHSNQDKTDFFTFADRRNIRKILEHTAKGDVSVLHEILELLSTNYVETAHRIARKAYGGSTYFGHDFSKEDFKSDWAQTILLNALSANSFSFLDQKHECTDSAIEQEFCQLALKHKVNENLNQKLNQFLLSSPDHIISLSKVFNWDDDKKMQIAILNGEGFIFYKKNPPIFSLDKNFPYVLKAPPIIGARFERKNISRLKAADYIREYDDSSFKTPKKYAYFLRYEYKKKYPNDQLHIAGKLPEVLIVSAKITPSGIPVTEDDWKMFGDLHAYLKENDINIEMKDRDIIKTEDGTFILIDTEIH